MYTTFIVYLRLCLLPLSALYNLVTTLRNIAYDKAILKSTKIGIPTISIGNITVGGTGKSPHIHYLVHLLQNKYNIAVVSRGYGRKTQGFHYVNATNTAGEVGDEPLQCKKKYPTILVAVGEKRAPAAQKILQDYTTTSLLLLDDAFQHRSIKRDIDIVLIEYNWLLKTDYLLPAGNLRESIQGLHRASLIIVTKCPVGMQPIAEAKLQLDIPIFYSYITYSDELTHAYTNEKIPLSLDNYLVISGIANPVPLYEYLNSTTINYVSKEFADHYLYSSKDIEEIVFFCTKNNLTKIITTEKDAVRLMEFLPLFQKNKIDVYYLPISISFTESEKFDAYIQSLIHFFDYSYHIQKGSKLPML